MDIQALLGTRDEPRFNKLLTEGYTFHQMKGQVEYLDRYMRSLMYTFPSEFEFHGITLTPAETEILESRIKMPSKEHRVQSKFDTNRTFMVDFNFSVNGEKIRAAQLRLFNVTIGSEATMDGKNYFFNQVLTDRGINIQGNDLYVFVGRIKFTSTRESGIFIFDKTIIKENVVVAEIHKLKDKKKGKGIDRLPQSSSLFVYLMTRFGFTKGVKHYFNVDMQLVNGDSYEDVYEQYAPQGYHVLGSVGKKPNGLHKDRWKDPDIFIITKHEDEDLVAILGANFFYLYDAITTRVDINTIEDPELWVELCGRFIFFSADKNSQWYRTETKNHLVKSIDVLMSDESRRELNQDGIIVNDMYDLMAWLIMYENTCYTAYNPADINNKRFNSLRFTLAYATEAISSLSYAMARECNAEGNLRLPMSAKKASKLIRGIIKEGLIRSVRSKNNEINTIQCPSDNRFIANTRKMLPQAKTHGGHKRRRPMFDPLNKLHESNLLISQVSGIFKADPSGKSIVGPYIDIDVGGVITPPKEYDDSIKRLGVLLKTER